MLAVLAAAASGCGKSSAGPSAGTVTQLRPTAAVPRLGETRHTTTQPADSTPYASVPPNVPATLPPKPSAALAKRPPIVQSPIPFGAKRKAEMASYARRHYGLDTYRLIDPHVIVIHYTETPDFQSTWNTFAPDVPDSELHELPNTCAHFVVDADGTIHQLVPVGIMCRHTVGLNWTAIGVEHVGFSDGEVLGRARQMRASLRLVRWLRCRFQIPLADVIGHNESLSSAYHHERVAALRGQTHSDFSRADMNVYRSRLRAGGPCH
jgi:beta-N-acetylhexosaminidase